MSASTTPSTGPRKLPKLQRGEGPRKRTDSAAGVRADLQAAGPGWFVYLLRCADGTLYCGCTNDLGRRIERHFRGSVKYTRGRLPVELAYSEAADGRSAAQRREAAIKRLPRPHKLSLCSSWSPPERRSSPRRKDQL